MSGFQIIASDRSSRINLKYDTKRPDKFCNLCENASPYLKNSRSSLVCYNMCSEKTILLKVKLIYVCLKLTTNFFFIRIQSIRISRLRCAWQVRIYYIKNKVQPQFPRMVRICIVVIHSYLFWWHKCWISTFLERWI